MKPSTKRGQGLSMETIIIAIIALIVLVVLVLIFTGKTREFSKQSASCTAKGGTCIPTGEPCSIPGISYACTDQATACCLSR